MSCEIRLDIADICVALHIDDDRIRDGLVSSYGPFVVPNARPRVNVRVEVQDGVQFVPLQPGDYVVNVEFPEGRLTFESFFEAGYVDLDSGEGYLVMGRSPYGDLENFLRALYAWLCLERQALLLHAAAVVRDGGAYVFFGNSGSGKTTVAELSSQYQVLSDDLTIVARAEGAYWVHGIPFRGASFDVPLSKVRVPLRGVFRLIKSDRHRANGLRQSQAVAGLLTCLPFVGEHPPNYERAMAICLDLVQHVPAKTLHFCRDKGFWKVVLDGQD
jgi:hypothetical protein